MFQSPSKGSKIHIGVALLTLATAISRFITLDTIPPGMWFDEAWVSVVARDWGNELYYSASFGGMHPAVVYLTKLGQAIAPANPLTIRYAIAAISTLTIPAAFYAFYQLFSLDQSKEESQNKALLATAVLSILYPFFHFSRLGLESILPAPTAVISFGLCAIYIKSQWQRSNYFHISSLSLGIWLGLSLYTFDTSRFIPLAVAFALIWLWWRNRQWWSLKHAFTNLAIITITAVCVAAPLLNYFWVNWGDFTARAAVTTSQTLGGEGGPIPLALLSSLGKTIGGLFIPEWGDQIARHNLPGRPVFDLVLSLLFITGLYQLTSKPKTKLAPVLWMWLFFNLLPVVLTNGAPTYTRIFGVVPAFALVVTIGIDGLRRRLPITRQWLAPACLLISGLITGYDYFVRWPTTPAYFNDFQTADWDIAHRAIAEARDTAVFFMPRRPYLADPTYDLLLSNTDIRQLSNIDCLVYRPRETVTYILDGFETDIMRDKLANQFGAEAIQQTEMLIDRNGVDEIGQVVQINGRGPEEPLDQPATFGEQISLVGSNRFESQVSAGSHIDLELHWLSQNNISQNVTLFIHLYAANDLNTPLAQLDAKPCLGTAEWEQGDVLIDKKQFLLPAELPTGDYILTLGWYDPITFARLPIPASDISDDRYNLATLTVE